MSRFYPKETPGSEPILASGVGHFQVAGTRDPTEALAAPNPRQCNRAQPKLEMSDMSEPPRPSAQNLADLARRCYVEASRAIHPSTKAFLLELAAEFEAASGTAMELDPDDSDFQHAVADRLAEVAKRGWAG